MSLRGHTSLTINDLADFMDENNIGKDDVLFHSTNHSGGHDIVYRASEDGAASVVEGNTPEDRAVYDEQGVAKPLTATQLVAGGTTITFDEATGTVTRSGGSFLSDGYNANMDLVVAGTASNDGTYLIASVTATVITIDDGADTDTYGVEFAGEGPLSGGETLDASQTGYDVGDANNLHVIIYLPDNATSLDWQLYTYDSVSEQWTLDTRAGTDGTESLAESDDDNPQRTIIELGGIEKVALVIENLAGVFTTGYSAWLAKA